MVRCLHLDRAPCFPYIRSLPLLRHRGRCLGGLERSGIPRNRLSPTPTLDHMTPRGLLPETTMTQTSRQVAPMTKRVMKELLRRSFPVELVSSFASSTSHRFLPPTLPSSPNNRDARRCFPSLNETINALDLVMDAFAFARFLLATTMVCFFQLVFINCWLMYYEGLGY